MAALASRDWRGCQFFSFASGGGAWTILGMSTDETLFPMPDESPEPETPAEEPPRGTPRFQRAERSQVKLLAATLNDLLAEDHRARMV